MTTETPRTYAKRSNAQRAAKAALGSPNAREGVAFTTEKTSRGWTWTRRGAPEPETAWADLTDQQREAVIGKVEPAQPAKSAAEIERAGLAAGLNKTRAREAARAVERSTREPRPTSEPRSGKRAAAEEAARRGELPDEPDFSAPTHARFRKKLAEVVTLAKAGDAAGLKAIAINPISSSPKAIDRYRNLAVLAIESRASV